MRKHFPLDPTTGAENQALLPWSDGVPATGTEGSYPGQLLFTDMEAELLNAQAAAGLVQSGTDLTQLTQAMSIGLFVGTFTGTANALVGALSGGAIPALLPNMRLRGVVGATANTGAVTLNVGGFTTLPGILPVVRRDGQTPLQSGDLSAGAYVTLIYDGTSFRVEAAVPSDILALIPTVTSVRLKANLNVYVRSDGNDANNGFANTAAGAFATIQGAFNTITQQYQTAGFIISILLGLAGTYAGAVLGPYSGTVQIVGETTWTDGAAFTVSNPGTQPDVIYSNVQQLNIRGVTIQPTYSGTPTIETGVQAANGSILLDNVRFIQNNNRSGYRDCYSNTKGAIQCINHIRFGGAGQRASVAEVINKGDFIAAANPASPTAFLTDGTATVLTAWTRATLGGICNWTNCTLTGAAASGPRYRAEAGGGIDTAGGGANYLPGSTAGSVDSSTYGWYR